MKDSIYRIVVDVWRLALKFGFRKMGDSEWEDFVSAGQELVIKYRAEGKEMERLCRDLFGVFQSFYEQIGKNKLPDVGKGN